MTTDSSWNELEGMDVQKMWIQQDGATCPTSYETMNLLTERFGDQIIC